jgi:large subunit ribosomal protein L21e
MKRLRKRIRQRGKIRLSEYFKELEIGQKVAFMPELSVGFEREHKRYRGLVGIVKEKRGSCYVVEIKKGNKIKQIIAHPVHLKKIA